MTLTVNFPALNAEYEFSLDESKLLSELAVEIVTALNASISSDTGDLAEDYLLLHKEQKSILSLMETPLSAGIREGDTIYIV